MHPVMLAEYLDERCDRSGGWNACWPWSRSTGSHRYGQGWDGETVRTAHSLAWQLVYGETFGLTIDHRCHVRICVNPNHLRLLPNVENATDNGHKKKTHCPRGHEYAGSNLYVNSKGWRCCRECARGRRAQNRRMAIAT